MTTVNSYFIGEKVRVSVSFTNSDDALTDPDTVTLNIRNPDGDLQQVLYSPGDIVRVGTGLYRYDIAPADVGGYWHYRWEGVGTVEAAHEATFYCRLAHAV